MDALADCYTDHRFVGRCISQRSKKDIRQNASTSAMLLRFPLTTKKRSVREMDMYLLLAMVGRCLRVVADE